jgi:hypothetical protein
MSLENGQLTRDNYSVFNDEKNGSRMIFFIAGGSYGLE